jgi:hypothetical protein
LSLEIEPQRPDLASGIGIERGRAVCELDEIMQILPGSSDNPHAYKCVTADLQYDNRVSAQLSLSVWFFSAPDRRRQARPATACSTAAPAG